METIATIFIILALVVMPIVIIFAMVKPHIFSFNGKYGRSHILAGLMILLVVFLGISLATIPVDDAKNVKPSTPQPSDKIQASATAVEAQPNKPAFTIASTPPQEVIAEENSLNITPEEFVKNFNATASTIDKNWVINFVNDKNTGGVDFAPMPDNVGMSASINKDNRMKMITLAIGGGDGTNRTVQIMSMILGASSSVNPTIDKGEVSKKIMKIVQDSFDNPNESQEVTIENIKYSATFTPSLGGEIFMIEPK